MGFSILVCQMEVTILGNFQTCHLRATVVGEINQLFCICLCYPVPAVSPIRERIGVYHLPNYIKASTVGGNQDTFPGYHPNSWKSISTCVASSFNKLGCSEAQIFLPVIFFLNQRRYKTHSTKFIGHLPDGIKLFQEIQLLNYIVFFWIQNVYLVSNSVQCSYVMSLNLRNMFVAIQKKFKINQVIHVIYIQSLIICIV